MSASLKNNANACAFCFCLGIRRPLASITFPIRIDREGLGETSTGTKQRIGLRSGKKVHRKHNLLKTLFRVEMFFFEAPSFVYLFGHLKTELFGNDDVTRSNFTVIVALNGFNQLIRNQWMVNQLPSATRYFRCCRNLCSLKI